MKWISTRKKKKPESKNGIYTYIPVILKDVNGESRGYAYWREDKKRWYSLTDHRPMKARVVAWFDIFEAFEMYFKDTQ